MNLVKMFSGEEKSVEKLEISVKIKNVYGVEKIYPLCDKAKYFAAIAGTATLTENSIYFIQNLGYKIVEETTSKRF